MRTCKSCGVTDPSRGFYGKYDRVCRECRGKRQFERRYGLTPTQYEAMQTAQGGLCRICGLKPDTSLHVDHDHDSGKVRGLLCRHCNLMLGHARDNTHVLSAAIMYLISAA